MAPFSKDRQPKKEFFVFERPMPAEGREHNLLGVAFENPRQATLGRYTPQGPEEDEAVDENRDSQGLTTTDYIASIGQRLVDLTVGTSQKQPDDADTQAGAQEAPALEEVSYTTPCAWPKDLANEKKIKIYPNLPVEAVGVEAILENVTEGDVLASIWDAMSFGLKVKKEELDTLIVPVFRRWSMEDPWAKINHLLHNAEYRKRVIDLLNKSHKDKKICYIATNLIACGGVSHDRVKADEQELSGSIKDKTETVPVRLQGSIHHIKRSTLKGAYETDVVLCMSYRRVRYEVVQEKSSWGLWPKGKKPKWHTKAIPFDREDGAKDVFYIDGHDTKGNAVGWMSAGVSREHLKVDEAAKSAEESDSQSSDNKSAMFENAELLDTAGEADMSEDDFPDDFFEPDESDSSDDEQ